jgi:glucose/arabinose dehydrogenase
VTCGDIVIARYHSADGKVADPTSGRIVLRVAHPHFDDHYGGHLQFGPNDGYLYLATGDGGRDGQPANGTGDYYENAQNPARLLEEAAGSGRLEPDQGALRLQAGGWTKSFIVS